MKTATLLTTLLTFNAVLGARFTQKRRESREANARRFFDVGVSSEQEARDNDHQGPARGSKSRPMVVADGPANIESRSNNSHVTYSGNWAGAFLTSSGFSAVTGTITVPTPSGANPAAQSAGAAWVGIDGASCNRAILQTGIDWYVTNGKPTYDAWYEWYPDYAYDFTGITINPGDSIRMTVFASTSTSGSAHIENLTNGQAVQQALSVSPDFALCQTNAEWIVEDFQSCDSSGACGLVPFANFGSIAFSQSLAVQAGTVITPATAGQGLQILDLYQNSRILTSCAVSGTTVGCVYI